MSLSINMEYFGDAGQRLASTCTNDVNGLLTLKLSDSVLRLR